MGERPLSELRVLDLTNVLAGPYCTYQLMLLGAEVVKIETRGIGDLARHLGSDAALNASGIGVSFLAQNAGKKSIEFDLKDPTDRATFAELVCSADVLVENFRPGVLTRLGFDWTELQRLNPRLIYCAISGFGQTGPMSQAPAYDQVIQGLSGMMSITGTPDTAPQRVGFPVCDTVGGLTAALAIAAAVVGRGNDGRGCYIDVSMLEASVSAMGWPVSNYLVTGAAPQPMGDQNATAAPSGTFQAADGPINIAANQQQQYERLCHAIGRLDLIDDPRFADRENRKIHRDDLGRELNDTLTGRTALEWEEMLSAAGVPAARILTVPEAVALDQLTYRRFFAELEFPQPAADAAEVAGHHRPSPDGRPAVPLRTLRVSSNGLLLDGARLDPPNPPPLLGQHNGEVDELIARWRTASSAFEATAGTAASGSEPSEACA
jgi:crotonobetainyl-CoA:carnitine CoA-transferase CaiB-like acyl-CoA transferase